MGPWLPTVLGPEYRRISYLDVRCDDNEAWFPLPLDGPLYDPQHNRREDDDSDSDGDEDFFDSPEKPVFENMHHLVLSFPSCTLIPGSFPVLRTASFDGLHPGITSVPWEQLEVLRLTNVPPSLVYTMAAISTAAREIYTGPGPRGWEPGAAPTMHDESETPDLSSPTHPSLTSLTLAPSPSRLVSSLSAPLLTSIAILPRFTTGSSETQAFVTALGMMILRSGPAEVKELRVKGMWVLTHAEVVRMLAFMPWLRVLEVRILGGIRMGRTGTVGAEGVVAGGLGALPGMANALGSASAQGPAFTGFPHADVEDGLHDVASELSDSAIIISFMSFIILLRQMSSPEAGPHAFLVCRMLKVLKIVMPPLSDTPGLRGGVTTVPRRSGLPPWRGGGGSTPNDSGGTQKGSSTSYGDSAHEADDDNEDRNGPRPDLALDDLVTMISARHVRGGLEEVMVQ